MGIVIMVSSVQAQHQHQRRHQRQAQCLESATTATAPADNTQDLLVLELPKSWVLSAGTLALVAWSGSAETKGFNLQTRHSLLSKMTVLPSLRAQLPL